MSELLIRPFISSDADAIWTILEPTIRAGETYPLPRDMTKQDALSYWLSKDHTVFIAQEGSRTVGTYYLKPNQRGGGSHVANCGYMVAPSACGRGIARAMCAHSLSEAAARNFLAMQFNFVVASNPRAIKLWQSFNFQTVGRLPNAFLHPNLGFVDALVMYRELDRSEQP